jgi:archaellum component FlaC
MATKRSKTNGHDPSTERMIAVLERIEARLGRVEDELHGFRGETRERIDATNQRLDAMNDRLSHLDAGMHSLHTDLLNKLKVTNQAIADVRDVVRHEMHEVAVLHETRFLRLEAAVFKPAAE